MHKFQFNSPQNTFASAYCQWALVQSRRWCVWIICTCGAFFAWFNLHLCDSRVNCVHRQLFLVPEPLNRFMSVFNTYYGTEDDYISKILTILHCGTLFWNYSTICRHSLLQISESLPILTSEKLCLSLVTDLLPINTFNCKIRLQLFLFSTTEFLKPTSQLFLSRLAAIKNTKQAKMSWFKPLICFQSSNVNIIWVCEISKLSTFCFTF